MTGRRIALTTTCALLVLCAGCMNEQAKISADAAARHAQALAAELPENNRAAALAHLAPAVSDSMGAPKPGNEMTVPAPGTPVDAGHVQAAEDQAQKTRAETRTRRAIWGAIKSSGGWLLKAAEGWGGPAGGAVGLIVGCWMWLKKRRADIERIAESQFGQGVIGSVGDMLGGLTGAKIVTADGVEADAADFAKRALADSQDAKGIRAEVRRRK